jgi:hypothetical protein
MNALTPSNATALATADYDPFKQAGDEMAGSFGTYLKFNGNSGEYTFGAEQEELPHGTELVVDMNSFRRGWICWKDEEVIDEVMTRVIDGPPPEKSALADHGPYVESDDKKEGWAEQAAISFKSRDGQDFIFKPTSRSALRALGLLLKDYGKDYKNHPGELPIITLSAGSFIPKNKKWGKKYNPILKITSWVNEEELLSSLGDDADDYEGGDEHNEAEPSQEPKAEEVTAPKNTKAQAVQKAAAPADATPTPRRRAW